MANEMTDKLQLIQSATIKGFLGLFGRSLSVAEGFSLEVFRGDTHLGSIISNDIKVAGDVKKRCERLGARDGDTILRVNLGPRMLTMGGKLYTQDGYTRAYEIMLELHISHPALFAQCYRQQSDPVMLAKTAIEGEFQKYAERNKHDAMDVAKLRLDAEQTLNIASNQRFGLSVTRAHKSYLWLDPKHAQKLEAWRQADVEQTKLQANAEVEKTRANTAADVTLVQNEREAGIQDFLDENEQKRVSRAADFVRIEEAKQQAHIRQQALFGTTAQEIMEALSTRLREEIAMGRPLSEIFNDYPQLRDIFLPPEQTLPTTERKFLQGSADRGFSIHETVSQPVGETIYISRTKENQLPLFAITRTTLEDDDRAIVGKFYSVQAGISQSKPENFEGEPLNLSVQNLAEPILFQVSLHTSENIALTTEWEKLLRYDPRNLESQMIEFTFQVIELGHSSLIIDFYHERHWFRTTRVEFDAIEQSEQTTASSRR